MSKSSMDKTPKYQPPESLIISPSGMRGVLSVNLFPEVIVNFCEAFGTWLMKKRASGQLFQDANRNCTVLIGMDTRTTGPLIKGLAIGALTSVGVDVIDMDVCPTPYLLFGHKYYHCDGTVIISASHNPPEYNGMKCLAPSGTFLSRGELDEINQYFYAIEPKNYVPWKQLGDIIKKTDLASAYISAMKGFLNLDLFKKNESKSLKVIVDPGAGAGSGITANILKDLGVDTIEINANKLGPYQFPREFEPIKAHLTELSQKLQEIHADVGFAHDCDADRLGLIGETGEIYPEDTILALIVNYMLKQEQEKPQDQQRKPLLVTNCASSLVLDDLAAKFGGSIIKTPVGERYLAEKMTLLLKDPKLNDQFIFGGEGSCGGVMLPKFNNTRDGMFAAVKIVEMLLDTKKKLSELVAELPHYVSLRKKISLQKTGALELMQKLKNNLKAKQIPFEEIDFDVKVLGQKEWTLVHPSNTEPIIRIITEAPTEKRAQELLDSMDTLLSQL